MRKEVFEKMEKVRSKIGLISIAVEYVREMGEFESKREAALRAKELREAISELRGMMNPDGMGNGMIVAYIDFALVVLKLAKRLNEDWDSAGWMIRTLDSSLYHFTKSIKKEVVEDE